MVAQTAVNRYVVSSILTLKEKRNDIDYFLSSMNYYSLIID